MCGPSSSMQRLAGEQESFAQVLQNSYKTTFANQQEILANLNNILSPVAAGTVNSVTPAETAAETTAAINNTGANYANAARALNGQLSGRGGDSGLSSGVDAQIRASLASKAAGDLSSQELGITERNADINRSERDAARSGLLALSGQYNPTGYGSLGANANASAYGEANQNNEASAQEFADIAGGVMGIAQKGAAALSGGISAISPNADTGILDAFANS